MKVVTFPPKFGENYNIGFVGFTYQAGIVSRGIAWFERWSRMSDITVSHTFIVTGPDECVEAHIGSGVARSTLSKYFNDPNCLVFFRQPKDWTPEMGNRIAASAAKHLGKSYDVALIAAHLLANTWLGRGINKLTRNWPDRLVSRWLGSGKKMICSRLVAAALEEQPELVSQGILNSPARTIDPQELFEDEIIFEPWKGKALKVPLAA